MVLQMVWTKGLWKTLSKYSHNNHLQFPGQEIERDSAEPEVDGIPREVIPNEADFLIGYATVPGFVSYRSRSHGSWYITKLCEMLNKHGTKWVKPWHFGHGYEWCGHICTVFSSENGGGINGKHCTKVGLFQSKDRESCLPLSSCVPKIVMSSVGDWCSLAANGELN